MDSSKPRNFGAICIWNPANLPLVEALGGHAELASHNAFERFDESAMIMGWGSHTPSYQRSVYVASPQSLIAQETWQAHNAAMSVATRIISAYEALNLSQAEAARRCGFSAQRFGNYVKGKRLPDLNALLVIANALETTPDELLGVNAVAGEELTDILCRLLELEGLAPDRAHTIAQVASATQQVLKSLPDDPGGSERARLAAQIVWSSQQHQATDKPSDR